MSGAALHEALCAAVQAATLWQRSPVPYGIPQVPAHATRGFFTIRPEGVQSIGGDGTGKAQRLHGFTLVLYARIGPEPWVSIQAAMTTAEQAIDVLHADPIGGARTDVGDVEFSYPPEGHMVVVSIPFTAVLWTAQT